MMDNTPQKANGKLTILFAEDSAPDRMILESILEEAGHTYISCENGKEAVQRFVDEKPDMVLLDVMMPVLSGLDASRQIRSISDGELIPIIFLTSLTDTQSLVECLEAGGDDFLPKPYNRVVIESKLKAFGRTRDMHRTVARQKNELALHNQRLIQEQTVAKQVFDKIAHTGCLNLDNIRYYMSPLAVFNGDVLVAEVSPSGSLIVLLGDFTGHGLPAAIGSMPLASIFYGMARKGFSVPDILKEINQKLHSILPIGFFCCATCIDINFATRKLKVWNGGLPESFLYRHEKYEYELVQSSSLPLGVLSNKDFNPELRRFDLNVGDRFYMWSDGVFEGRNQQGEMFGEDRLHQLMYEYKGKNILFDEILKQVHGHIGSNDKDDDISLVEITVEDVAVLSNTGYFQVQKTGRTADWGMTFEVKDTSLKEFDPLPLLINVLSEVPGLRRHSTVLYTILAELYSNALEHGVLGLPSVLKSSPEGFAEYYQTRAKKIDMLEEGMISFSMHHGSTPCGGLLTLRVKDSGTGFDYEPVLRKIEQGRGDKTNGSTFNQPKLHGRGLPLIASMAEDVTIHDPGNDVEVKFKWIYED